MLMDGVSGRMSTALRELVSHVEALVTEPAKADAKPDDPNPFTLLFAFKETFGGEEKASAGKTGDAGVKEIRPDSDVERVIRSQALLEARWRRQEFYARCKGTLKMPVFG
jgi:hypothetical protein